MKSLFTSIVCILIFQNLLFAQTGKNDFAWDPTTPTVNIPDSLLDEDAVKIYQDYELINRYYMTSGSNFSIELLKTKIKILNKAGLDKYSNYSFFKSRGGVIKKLDARTIKKDGRIVDLNANDIKVLSINSSTYRRGFENLRFTIPGVEIGDEIEIIFITEYDGLIFGQDINMYSEAPILKSTFQYVCDKNVGTDFRMYNNMPEPTITKNLSQTTFSWELANLPGIGDQEYGIKNETLPFIRFAVRGFGGASDDFKDYLTRIGISSNSWANVYDNYSTVYDNDAFEKSYKGVSLEGFLKRYNEKNPKLTIEQKILFLTSLMNDSVKVKPFVATDPSRPAMYYINNKTIDIYNLNKLIRTFLQLNEIEFYVAFARDRYDGTLDLEFASPKTITDIFYVIPNENKELHYLYPTNENRKYYIDELPNWLAGSTAILVKKKSENSRGSEILKLTIPYNDLATNVWNKMTKIKVDISKQEMDFVSKQTFIGDFSTNLRNEIVNATTEDEPIKYFKKTMEINDLIKVDTFTIDNNSTLYPYNFNFSYSGKIKSDIQKINGNIYSIPLELHLDHFLLRTNDNKRFLNYYCPFQYTNTQKIYFQFDKDFEIIPNEIEKLNSQISFSNYSIKVSKIGTNILMVESKYDISKLKLNPLEYYELHKFNESVKQAMQSRILIKTL